MPGLIPFICFGSLCLVAAILVLYLPETLGTKLPDTIEEAVAQSGDIDYQIFKHWEIPSESGATVIYDARYAKDIGTNKLTSKHLTVGFPFITSLAQRYCQALCPISFTTSCVMQATTCLMFAMDQRGGLMCPSGPPTPKHEKTLVSRNDFQDIF